MIDVPGWAVEIVAAHPYPMLFDPDPAGRSPPPRPPERQPIPTATSLPSTTAFSPQGAHDGEGAACLGQLLCWLHVSGRG
jgi:hypothetical protein